MSQKHTPGPWGVHPYTECTGELRAVESEDGNFMAASIAIGHGQTLICEVGHNSTTRGYPRPTLNEMRANAALIAAAPELLEALEEFLRAGIYQSTDFQVQGKAHELACLAIAKAKGGSR